MELTNSKRVMHSASYVTTQFTPTEQAAIETQMGSGVAKANGLRALSLTNTDVAKLRELLSSREAERIDSAQLKLLSIAERLSDIERHTPTIALAPVMAPISYDELDLFYESVSHVRGPSLQSELAKELNRRRRKISPIGWLHLERIEMYPAGVQRGELVFTVPMAPGETVAISHREWSTSSREFEDIVQDYFESYSERGVAEKSDAAMSSESESKHSSVFNFGASLSGTYVGVSLTTTTGLTTTSEERQSLKNSMQKTREVTEKASARVRKEHKVSMRLETKTGNEDRSAKTFSNGSTSAQRIDYYRLMRKWRTDLFRYGLRQTYDIAIPLPGARLWALHQRVASIDRELQSPIVFSLKQGDLNDLNWTAKAADHGAPPAVVPPPPLPEQKIFITPESLGWWTATDAALDRFGKIEFDVPPGYWLKEAKARAVYAAAAAPHFTWFNGDSVHDPQSKLVTGDLSQFTNAVPHPSGRLAVTYSYSNLHTAGLTLELTFERTPEATWAWQRDAWNAIKASSDARETERRAVLQEERDRLWRQLNDKDTLSLRRLEREELMRLVMNWLLGPDSELSPGGDRKPSWPSEPPQATLRRLLDNEKAFYRAGMALGFTGAAIGADSVSPSFEGVTPGAATEAILFGEFVKFMHQAVEWENLLYFLYPYFWGSESIGRDKFLFAHADPEHERFLRAGYVRIVLPVRPGFELDFTGLVENGTLSGHLSAPYMTVAEDIANFARTNYGGIPPANPEDHARPLLYPEQRATWKTIQETMKEIDLFRSQHQRYPAALSELSTGEPVDAWGHPLVYRVPGLGADYDLISLGKDNAEGGKGLNADISSAAGASLIASWCDYTPTSALDIQVETKLENMA